MPSDINSRSGASLALIPGVPLRYDADGRLSPASSSGILLSTPIPAGTFVHNGDRVDFAYAGTCEDGAGVLLKLGGAAADLVFDTSALTVAGHPSFVLTGSITYCSDATDPSRKALVTTCVFSSTGVAAPITSLNEVDGPSYIGQDITLELWGTGTTEGDVTLVVSTRHFSLLNR